MAPEMTGTRVIHRLPPVSRLRIRTMVPAAMGSRIIRTGNTDYDPDHNDDDNDGDSGYDDDDSDDDSDDDNDPDDDD